MHSSRPNTWTHLLTCSLTHLLTCSLAHLLTCLRFVLVFARFGGSLLWATLQPRDMPVVPNCRLNGIGGFRLSRRARALIASVPFST